MSVMSEITTIGHNLKTHKRTHTREKPYKCQLCQKSFGRNGDLKKHTRTHTGEKPCKCQLCQKSFSRNADLNSHMRTHTGEKPYKCQLCQKSFSQRKGLKRHMKSHTGEKSYMCHLCQKSFSEGCDLKRHMITHTGEKPYTCQLCQKSFTQDGNLKTHMRSHTGEKPYKCHLCKKYFSESGVLKRHMRTHTGMKPYKCQLCQKCFSQGIGLKRHMRTHAGEKPCISLCQLYQKSVTTACGLKNNALYHTGEGHYQCEIYNSGLTRDGNLQRHRQTCATENQQNRYKSKCSSSVMPFELHVGSQPQCLEVENQSTAGPSVQFTALTGTSVIDKSNRLSNIMHFDASQENSPLAKTCLEEYLFISVTKSLEDEKPFVEKSFGCGLCGEMLEMETEFQSHCFGHRFSPPDDLVIAMY